MTSRRAGGLALLLLLVVLAPRWLVKPDDTLPAWSTLDSEAWG